MLTNVEHAGADAPRHRAGDRTDEPRLYPRAVHVDAARVHQPRDPGKSV